MTAAGSGSVTVDTAIHVYGNPASWQLVLADDRVSTHVRLRLGNHVTLYITSVAAITHLQQAVNDAAEAFTGTPRRTTDHVASPAGAGRVA
ncbi:hypothetical protein G1H11_11065 [Phytoactinopolyspora alkaliphila]|uniref:Uncharacterized protein n=1 Tax=Phytoactinopolyspora alkaliphila TaxID=1783498 RepID=A0A6N9YLA4_9ACTN|nr:hypothetical protein [Phytoactinopolyspora alkaliphila]NED95851.1 hypothetical protein [Phytoactinopolyspora alkaliphila]